MTTSPATTPKTRVLVVLGNLALNGQERGNVQVFTSLKKAGVDARFVTHSDWGHLHIQPYLERLDHSYEAIPYARHFTHRMQRRDWPKNLRRLMRASRAFRQIAREYRPTHIHVANPHYFLSVLPALLTTRVPVVFRLGDEPTMHHRLYRLLWQRFIVPRVSAVVCVSEFVRRSAIASGVPDGKSRVIHSFPPERPPAAKPLTVPPFEGRTVVYVGQMTPQKGVDVLVRAAIRMAGEREDVRFLLAGLITRNNAFAMRLLNEVAASGHGDRIRFLGYVEDVPELLAAADVHACPSVYEEPLANTVVEAKRAGVPSVVFASGGLPELMNDGIDGTVVREKSPEALADAIASYLDMEDEALARRKDQATASLERLGITEKRFREAWASVYAGTTP